MRLVSTMPYTRLVKNLDRMFPGTDTPRSLVVPIDDTSTPTVVNTGDGRSRLLRLIANGERPIYSSREVASLTGLTARNLKREFGSAKVAPVAERLGWTLASNKRVGQRGKGLNLVRLSLLETREASTCVTATHPSHGGDEQPERPQGS
jgi:hypothetical protein